MDLYAAIFWNKTFPRVRYSHKGTMYQPLTVAPIWCENSWGDTPRKIWWGYAADFSKPLPVIFSTQSRNLIPTAAAPVAVKIILEGLLFRILSIMMTKYLLLHNIPGTQFKTGLQKPYPFYDKYDYIREYPLGPGECMYYMGIRTIHPLDNLPRTTRP